MMCFFMEKQSHNFLNDMTSYVKINGTEINSLPYTNDSTSLVVLVVDAKMLSDTRCSLSQVMYDSEKQHNINKYLDSTIKSTTLPVSTLTLLFMMQYLTEFPGYCETSINLSSPPESYAEALMINKNPAERVNMNKKQKVQEEVDDDKASDSDEDGISLNSETCKDRAFEDDDDDEDDDFYENDENDNQARDNIEMDVSTAYSTLNLLPTCSYKEYKSQAKLHLLKHHPDHAKEEYNLELYLKIKKAIDILKTCISKPIYVAPVSKNASVHEQKVEYKQENVSVNEQEEEKEQEKEQKQEVEYEQEEEEQENASVHEQEKEVEYEQENVSVHEQEEEEQEKEQKKEQEKKQEKEKEQKQEKEILDENVMKINEFIETLYDNNGLIVGWRFFFLGLKSIDYMIGIQNVIKMNTFKHRKAAAKGKSFLCSELWETFITNIQSTNLWYEVALSPYCDMECHRNNSPVSSAAFYSEFTTSTFKVTNMLTLERSMDMLPHGVQDKYKLLDNYYTLSAQRNKIVTKFPCNVLKIEYYDLHPRRLWKAALVTTLTGDEWKEGLSESLINQVSKLGTGIIEKQKQNDVLLEVQNYHLQELSKITHEDKLEYGRLLNEKQMSPEFMERYLRIFMSKISPGMTAICEYLQKDMYKPGFSIAKTPIIRIARNLTFFENLMAHLALELDITPKIKIIAYHIEIIILSIVRIGVFYHPKHEEDMQIHMVFSGSHAAGKSNIQNVAQQCSIEDSYVNVTRETKQAYSGDNNLNHIMKYYDEMPLQYCKEKDKSEQTGDPDLKARLTSRKFTTLAFNMITVTEGNIQRQKRIQDKIETQCLQTNVFNTNDSASNFPEPILSRVHFRDLVDLKIPGRNIATLHSSFKDDDKLREKFYMFMRDRLSIQGNIMMMISADILPKVYMGIADYMIGNRLVEELLEIGVRVHSRIIGRFRSFIKQLVVYRAEMRLTHGGLLKENKSFDWHDFHLIRKELFADVGICVFAITALQECLFDSTMTIVCKKIVEMCSDSRNELMSNCFPNIFENSIKKKDTRYLLITSVVESNTSFAKKTVMDDTKQKIYGVASEIYSRMARNSMVLCSEESIRSSLLNLYNKRITYPANKYDDKGNPVMIVKEFDKKKIFVHAPELDDKGKQIRLPVIIRITGEYAGIAFLRDYINTMQSQNKTIVENIISHRMFHSFPKTTYLSGCTMREPIMKSNDQEMVYPHLFKHITVEGNPMVSKRILNPNFRDDLFMKFKPGAIKSPEEEKQFIEIPDDFEYYHRKKFFESMGYTDVDKWHDVYDGQVIDENWDFNYPDYFIRKRDEELDIQEKKLDIQEKKLDIQEKKLDIQEKKLDIQEEQEAFVDEQNVQMDIEEEQEEEYEHVIQTPLPIRQ
jgi:chemotaxis protein histidine kinase CheA